MLIIVVGCWGSFQLRGCLVPAERSRCDSPSRSRPRSDGREARLAPVERLGAVAPTAHLKSWTAALRAVAASIMASTRASLIRVVPRSMARLRAERGGGRRGEGGRAWSDAALAVEAPEAAALEGVEEAMMVKHVVAAPVAVAVVGRTGPCPPWLGHIRAVRGATEPLGLERLTGLTALAG